MEQKAIFSILKMEPTKDENQIKDAYRKLLVNVNPEDDPEGFKQLRQAYEDAINDARTEETEKKVAVTPIEKWMEKVEKVYAFLSSRIEIDRWRELLSSEVCQNLDSNLEARSAMLSFLTDHYRLKNSIWRLICDTFLIQEEKESLYEEFPVNFINYVIYHCNEPDEDDFSFELFEGEDDGEYDTFLYQYTEMSRNMDEENLDDAEKNLKVMEALSVSHPIFNLEKARYEQGRGNQSLAVEMVTALLEKHSDDLRILAIGAEVLWKAGNEEKAAEYFRQTVQRVPEHYLACKRLAHYYLNIEEYKKAKEFCVNALSTGSQEEELLENSRKINDSLIEEFEKRAGDETDMKPFLETGWCCLENGHYQKAIELVCHKIPPKEHKAEHSNLLGRLYFMNKQYDKAIEYTKIRIELIKEEAVQEEKSENDRRMGTAYELWAQACWGMAREDENSENKELYEEAIKKIEQALYFSPEQMGYLNVKVRLCMKLEKYFEVVDVCDQMEKIVPGDFWSMIYYQEAYFHLHKAQEVIDYFYKAKEIYPYYPKMYELAIQVFLDFDQYDDAKGMLAQAREMKVESNQLDLYEVKLYRLISDNDESRQKAYDSAIGIREKLKKNEASKEEMAEINAEIAKCCHNLDMLTEAMEYAENALKLSDKREYDWIKGNVLLDLDDYEKALKCYLPCEELWDNSEMLSERIGYCYKSLEHGNHYENYTLAYKYYKKTLEINSENIRAMDVMVEVCRYLYKCRYEELYFKEAILYNTKLIEIDKKNEFHHYNTRGRTYMDAQKWDLSLIDLEKACELEPEEVVPYMNKGCVYKYTERYEEALREYEKASECMDEESPYIKVYGNYGDCYERIGNKEKAVEYYLKNNKLFPNNDDTADDIIRLYCLMGEFDKALDIVEKVYQKNSIDYLDNKGTIYLDKGDIGKGIRCFNKILVNDKMSEKAYDSLGDAYLLKKNQPIKAIKMYKKRLECLETPSDMRNTWKSLMCAYFFMGVPEKGLEYFKLFMENIESQEGGLEIYLNHPPYLAARLYSIASIYLYTGDIKNAEYYTDSLRKQKKCQSCVYQYCYELNIMEGLLLMCKGEKEKALWNLEKALQQEPNSWLISMIIKRLQK